MRYEVCACVCARACGGLRGGVGGWGCRERGAHVDATRHARMPARSPPNQRPSRLGTFFLGTCAGCRIVPTNQLVLHGCAPLYCPMPVQTDQKTAHHDKGVENQLQGTEQEFPWSHFSGRFLLLHLLRLLRRIPLAVPTAAAAGANTASAAKSPATASACAGTGRLAHRPHAPCRSPPTYAGAWACSLSLMPVPGWQHRRPG